MVTASVRFYITSDFVTREPNYLGYVDTIIAEFNTGLSNSNTQMRVETACVELTDQTFTSSAISEIRTIKGTTFVCINLRKSSTQVQKLPV